MNKVTLEAKVGLFFLASIAIFVFVWFQVLDFGKQEGFLLKAPFRSVDGLVRGAQVQMAGIKVGLVKDIAYDPDTGKALVSMDIKDTYRDRIPEDSRVSLKTKGLLGDRYVNIEPGKPNARKLRAGEEMPLVFDPPDTDKVFESVGLVAQDLQVISRTTRKELVDQKGAEKVSAVLDNSSAAFKNLNELLERNRSKIDQTVDDSGATVKGLKEIVQRNHDKINSGVDDLQRFARSMDKTSQRLDKSSKDIASLTQDVLSGKGTLGKLVSDEGLYREARGLVRQVSGLADRIQNGPGVAGRIINDPELYFEARRAIRNMNKTAEDVSEATPVSTLAIILGSIFK